MTSLIVYILFSMTVEKEYKQEQGTPDLANIKIALLKAVRIRELLEAGAPQSDLLEALDELIADLGGTPVTAVPETESVAKDRFEEARTRTEDSEIPGTTTTENPEIELQETYREKQVRLVRHTDSRVVTYVLQNGQNGLLVHPTLSKHLQITLGLSESQVASAKDRLVAQNLLEVGFRKNGERRFINSYKVDPVAIAAAIEAGVLVDVEDPLVAIPHTRHVRSRAIVPRPRPVSPSAPELPSSATTAASKDTLMDIKTIMFKPVTELTQEEVEAIINDLEPEARFSIFFREKRTFGNALSMQKALINETKLPWETLRYFILSLPKEGLVRIERVPGTEKECFGELTDKGLALLEVYWQGWQNDQSRKLTEESTPPESKEPVIPAGDVPAELEDGEEVSLRTGPGNFSDAQRRRLKRIQSLDPTPATGYRGEVPLRTFASQNNHTSKTGSGRRTGGRSDQII